MRDFRRTIDLGLGQTAPVPAMPVRPVGYSVPAAQQQVAQQPMQVAIPPAQLAAKVIDTVRFWVQSMSDSANTMHLGLEDETLKRDALGFAQQLAAFQQSRLPEGQVSIDAARVLGGEYRNLIGNFRNFVSHVYERLASGEWLGWLFPLWVDSMRRSLDYSLASLDRADAGRMRAPAQARAEEICTWTRLMLDASVIIAHLLDPSEANLIAQARNFGMQFGQLNSACASPDPKVSTAVDNVSMQFLTWIKQSGIGTAKVKSIISPTVAASFARSAEKFVQVLGEAKTGRLL
jgi:Protein of unknown function (DUF2935).